MKKIFTFTIILLALIACTVAVRAIIGYFSVTQATSYSTATDMAPAQPEGYVRIFLDEGESMYSLLASYQKQGLWNTGSLSEYVSKLLNAFEAEKIYS